MTDRDRDRDVRERCARIARELENEADNISPKKDDGTGGKSHPAPMLRKWAKRIRALDLPLTSAREVTDDKCRAALAWLADNFANGWAKETRHETIQAVERIAKAALASAPQPSNPEPRKDGDVHNSERNASGPDIAQAQSFEAGPRSDASSGRGETVNAEGLNPVQMQVRILSPGPAFDAAPQPACVGAGEDPRNASRVEQALAWAINTFGPVAADYTERALRFVEEALELGHAAGLDQERLQALIQRVYSRPPGLLQQEVGQACITLEMFAWNYGIDADEEATKEFARVQTIPKDEWARRHSAKTAIGITSDSPVLSPAPSPQAGGEDITQREGSAAISCRGDPCSFCGRADVGTVDGPTTSICADCAENALNILDPAPPW